MVRGWRRYKDRSHAGSQQERVYGYQVFLELGSRNPHLFDNATGIAAMLFRRPGFRPDLERTFRFFICAIVSTTIQIEGGANHALP